MIRLETRYSWSPDGPWSAWTRSGVGIGHEVLYVVSAPRGPHESSDFHFRWSQDRYVLDTDVLAPAFPPGWGWKPCTQGGVVCAKGAGQ
jgi:hypothetical protein